MSAVNIICKRRHGCLHIVTDSASYVDGIVDGLGRPKVLTVPAWPGAITGRGPALAGAIVGETLSCKFPTFDEAVAGAEEVRSEEHTSELQSPDHLVCRLLL